MKSGASLTKRGVFQAKMIVINEKYFEMFQIDQKDLNNNTSSVSSNLLNKSEIRGKIRLL